MVHKIYRAISCRVSPPYQLEIAFNDGEVRTIDLGPVLAGNLYAPLRDQTLFSQVRIDEETGVPVWPNGADFDPTMLHDWDQHLPDFLNAAEKWKSQAA